MTALEEIKKALEGVTHAPGKWESEGTAVYCDDATGQRVCDTKGEYLFWSEDQKRNAAVYIAAANPVAISELLSTLESLQRENEELRLKETGLKIAITQRDAYLARADSAEAEVKRLRNKVAARALTDKQLADEIEAIDEACKGGFGEGGGSPGEWWYERADELEHERTRRELESQLQRHNSRTALASTGGEHHGN